MTKDIGKTHILDSYKFDTESALLSTREKLTIVYEMNKQLMDNLISREIKIHPKDILEILKRCAILQAVNVISNWVRFSQNKFSFLKIYSEICNDIEEEYNLLEKAIKDDENDKKKEDQRANNTH